MAEFGGVAQLMRGKPWKVPVEGDSAGSFPAVSPLTPSLCSE